MEAHGVNNLPIIKPVTSCGHLYYTTVPNIHNYTVGSQQASELCHMPVYLPTYLALTVLSVGHGQTITPLSAKQAGCRLTF